MELILLMLLILGFNSDDSKIAEREVPIVPLAEPIVVNTATVTQLAEVLTEVATMATSTSTNTNTGTNTSTNTSTNTDTSTETNTNTATVVPEDKIKEW